MVCPALRGPEQKTAGREPSDDWDKGERKEGECPQGTPSQGLNREALPLSGASKGLTNCRL